MTVVVQIEGRDAIPVRAIPMLTDWQALSPDVVAEILSGGSDHCPSFDGLAAYRLHPDGRVVRESQRSWSSWIVRNLKAASEAIKAKQTCHETGYQQWRNEALALLPAGVFVWRDEFEAAHLDEYGPDSLRARFNPDTFQPESYALNYSPQYGPTESWQKLISEGFEQLLAPAVPQSYLDLLTLRTFYGADTHDDHWLGLGSVSPRDAAYLLYGLDPIEVAKLRSEPNVNTIVVGETNNERVTLLGNRLCDYDEDNHARRSWRDWHGVAKEIEADYEKGFDYFFDEVVRPSTGKVAVESTQAQSVQPQVAAPSLVRPKAKHPTWLDVSTTYIVEVMRGGQYPTCKELYRALEAKAGPDSPFDKGAGDNRDSLFVRDIAQSLSLKTVQNEWRTLRELARK
jgi:hypothetical protein